MDITQLEELGLRPNESKVYLALLEIGETKTGPLVKKTSLHRVLIYDALESLIKKGLVSYVIKENIKYFQATDPNRLIDFLKEKEELAKSLLPELIIRRQSSKVQQQVLVYESLKGLKSALNNMLAELSPGGTHYVFASGNMADSVGPYYDIYQKTKKKNKITTYGIHDEEFRRRKDILKRTVARIRFYSFSYFPTDTWIYNDKVLIVTYTSKPPIAILIVNKETAESYKKFFDSFWKKAKP